MTEKENGHGDADAYRGRLTPYDAKIRYFRRMIPM